MFIRKLFNGEKIAENLINNLETSNSVHRLKKPGKENCYLEISKMEQSQDLEICPPKILIS